MNRVLMHHPLNGLTSPLRFNSVSQLVQADLTTTNVWLLFLTDKHFFTFSSKCIVFVLIRLFPRIIRYSNYMSKFFSLPPRALYNVMMSFSVDFQSLVRMHRYVQTIPKPHDHRAGFTSPRRRIMRKSNTFCFSSVLSLYDLPETSLL